ncbi:MAG: hypothetical protein ACTSQR_07015, partial [Promethearchaeota archaeon]
MAKKKEVKKEVEEEGEEEKSVDEASEADKAAGLDYKIENVVATVVVEITEKIDLNIIARK